MEIVILVFLKLLDSQLLLVLLGNDSLGFFSDLLSLLLVRNSDQR